MSKKLALAGSLVLVAMTLSACAGTAGGVAGIQVEARGAQGSQPERPPLPTGPGPVLGSQLTYDEWRKQIERLGETEQSVKDQDILRVDVGQDVQFAASDAVEESRPIPLTRANVVDDNLVVVEYEGDNCVVPVGAKISLSDRGPDIEMYAGNIKGKTDCLGRIYTYRAPFYVEGARERMGVTSIGTNVKEGVMLAFLQDLPELVIWPDELPKVG